MAALALTRRFPGRRVFITGAGSGLGAAMARLLAADGWTIGAVDVREEPAKEIAADIARLGGVAHPYAFDVTDRVAYKDAVTHFLDAAGGVDLVVNNAGVTSHGLIGDADLEHWDWLLGINLTGVMNGCHFFAPTMRKQRSGQFLNTSSAAGFVPVPRLSAYCTAKAGVRMLSEVLHNEMHEHNVGVTILMPEFFRTNLIDRFRGTDQERARYILANARYTADEVALRALDAAARNELHVVFGKQANLAWRMIRWFPRRAMGMVRRDIEKMDAKVARGLSR